LRFDAEIAPLPAEKFIIDKEGKIAARRCSPSPKTEGNRSETNMDGLAKLKPVRRRRQLHHRRQCQSAFRRRFRGRRHERQGSPEARPEAARIYRGFEVAGCHPDEMGIGPCSRAAAPEEAQSQTRHRHLELNEAFAVQVIYCRATARHSMGAPQRRRRRDLHRPSLRHERRPSHRHALIEGKRRGKQVCGRHHVHRRRPGCAALFEIV